jgi:cyclic-di-GMP-binding biofilm dispersal mediator protein
VSRVLVTGATGALGGVIARELASRGARLALHGRDAGRLEALAAELGAASATAADLTAPGEPERVVGAAAGALGGLDAAVCAVGVVAFGPVEALDDATLATLMEINLHAPVRLTRALASRMERGAVIVNISAIVAEMPTAGMAAYSASKAALTAFDRAGGRELRRQGIRVVDVRPPHLATGLENRPIAGAPPRLPEGQDPAAWARRIADAIDDPSCTEVGSEA